MANEIVVEVSAKLDQVQKDLDNLKKVSETAGSKVSDSLGKAVEGGFGRGLDNIKESLIELGLAIAGGELFKKVVESAIEAENALNTFNSSLAAGGIYTQEASEKFEHYAVGLERVTTVSRELIEANAATLVSIGRLQGEGLERATKASLELAAGLNISVESAFRLVSRAAEGTTAGLRRYGIRVNEGLPASEKFSQVLGVIENRFKGLAESKTATFAGALEQMKNKFNELAVTLGDFIIKSPVVVAIINEVGRAFEKLTTSLGSVGKGDPIGDLIKKLLGFGPIVIETVIKPLELAYNIGRLAFYGIAEAVQVVVVAVTIVGSVIAEMVAVFVKALSKVGAVISLFNKALGKSVQETLEGFGNAVAENALNATKATESALGDINEKTKKAAEDLFKAPFSKGAEELITNLEKVADNAAPIGLKLKENMLGPLQESLPTFFQYVVGGYKSLFVKVRDESGRITVEGQALIATTQNRFKSAFQNFSSGFAKSFSSIGEALVKGQNVFQAFGNILLGLVGDLAIQVGEASFLMGLATYNFGQAGLGLALIAVGGVLKALGGGSGSSTSSVAGIGSGGGGGGPSIGSSSGNTNTPVAAQAGPTVQVNVQGNVLDRRQTGLELVEVLNESFGTNGNIINKA